MRSFTLLSGRAWCPDFLQDFAAPDASSKEDKDLRFVFGIVAAVP